MPYSERPDTVITDADAAQVAKAITEAAYDNPWLNKWVTRLAQELMWEGTVKTNDVALDQAAVVIGAILARFSAGEIAKALTR